MTNSGGYSSFILGIFWPEKKETDRGGSIERGEIFI